MEGLWGMSVAVPCWDVSVFGCPLVRVTGLCLDGGDVFHWDE